MLRALGCREPRRGARVDERTQWFHEQAFPAAGRHPCSRAEVVGTVCFTMSSTSSTVQQLILPSTFIRLAEIHEMSLPHHTARFCVPFTPKPSFDSLSTDQYGRFGVAYSCPTRGPRPKISFIRARSGKRSTRLERRKQWPLTRYEQDMPPRRRTTSRRSLRGSRSRWFRHVMIHNAKKQKQRTSTLL